MLIMKERIAALAQALSNNDWGTVIIVPWINNIYDITATRWCGECKEGYGDMWGCNHFLSGAIIRDIKDFETLAKSVMDMFEKSWNAHQEAERASRVESIRKIREEQGEKLRRDVLEAEEKYPAATGEDLNKSIDF